jgi:hypothetical protein
VKAWQAMEGRAALNLQLLQGIDNAAAGEEAFDLATLPERATKTMSDIAA